MGELINHPNLEKPVLELDPASNESWDAIIDEAYRTGSCFYEYEGQRYELKVEDLGPDTAA